MQSPEQLTEYLKQVSALETSVYNQERICKGVKEALEKRKAFPHPGGSPRTLFPASEKETTQHKKAPYVVFWAVVVLGCLLDCVLVLLKAPLFAVLSVGLATLLILFATVIIKTEIDYRKTYRNLVEEYRDNPTGDGNTSEHPQKSLVEARSDRQKEPDPKEGDTAARLRTALSEMNNALHQSKQLLAGLYDRNIIPHRYRNLVAMTTMYEYFSTGRTSTLTGDDGAFRLYEAELRQNVISDDLHEISRNPEQIRTHQSALYSALETGNRTLRNITSGIGLGADTAAEDAELLAGVTAYVAGLSRESAAALADLK